jgi:poly(A) polymerase
VSKQQDYLHHLKRAFHDIDPQAVSIIKRLKEAQFDGYLVGGCVRDLLVGIRPKDFDIATNASPNEIKKKVPFSFIIGRRFKLVHARRGEKIFEIATYRRLATDEEIEQKSQNNETGLFLEENFFGTLEEDSFRRDFTVNALFYDPLDEKLIDHCSGLKDIESQTLRMIGDPTERIKEDPVRILRALRLSQKINFSLEPSLRQAILENNDQLQNAILPRCREEWIKFFKLPSIDLSLVELYDLNVFKILIPTLHEVFSDEVKQDYFRGLIRRLNIVGFDLTDTIELFAGVIYSYLLTQFEHPELMNINELSEDKNFQNFWKEELGVFKAEMNAIEITFQYIQVLRDKESYLKKGDRRKRALIYHPQFQLALKLGLLSSEFDSADFAFWMEQLELFQ